MKFNQILKFKAFYKTENIVTTAIIFFCILSQSCVMQKSDLMVEVINKSGHQIFVGELQDCDSCTINQDVSDFCLSGATKAHFPKVIKINDSQKIPTKSFDTERIYVINLDSLYKYCNDKQLIGISNKKWITKLEKTGIDTGSRKCIFIIEE